MELPRKHRVSRAIPYVRLQNVHAEKVITPAHTASDEPSARTIFWVRFSAYAIPLAFLGYVLYMNFLPFGYHKTFTIDVGSPTDTSGEFYLEPSRDLSERKVAPNGATYRELSGTAIATFKPSAILKNATISVEVVGDGVSLIPPHIDFDPATINWDYSWDFSKGIPEGLTGGAFMFDGALTFNGIDTRLDMASSSDMFEDGPFTVYAEWTPKDDKNNAQQIVGHYNWELWQNKDSVSFQVGRMNDAQGPAYSVRYPVTPEFFNTKHSALATYNPSDNGYVELFIDGAFVKRIYFGTDKIWKDYGNQNITFGKSNHSIAQYFKGVLYKVALSSKNILPNQTKIDFVVNNESSATILLLSNSTSTLSQIKLNAIQR